MYNIIPESEVEKVKAELAALDRSLVEIDGKHVKPSGCYYFEADPAHILYNTNCPETLKEKIEGIIKKYLPHESGS